MDNILWFVLMCLVVSHEFGLNFARIAVMVSPCLSNRETCYPYEWKSNITTWVIKAHHTLIVQFTRAPPQTNFTMYRVELKGDFYKKAENVTSEYEVPFYNICNGDYTISVKPLDAHRSVSGKCQCYKSEARCMVCRRTYKKITISDLDDFKCNETTNWKYQVPNSTTTMGSSQTLSSPAVSLPAVSSSAVSSPNVSSPNVSSPNVSSPTVSSPNVSSPNVSSPTVSSPNVSSPAVSSPTVNPFPRSYLSFEKSSITKETTMKEISTAIQSNHSEPVTTVSQNSSSSYSSKTSNVDKTVWWVAFGIVAAILLAFFCFIQLAKRENLTDKKILFLYSHDHQHHLDVGKAMAAYLQHFKCNVLYPPLFAEEEIKQWLHKTVADCDFVLLLHSECIKRQSEPWANGLEYPQLRDNRNENVLMSILTMVRECPLLQLYHSKYISCRLEHLSENYVLNEFPSVQNFVLIRDLKKMVYYIHHIPPNSVLKTLTLGSSDSSASTMALQQAAQKAAEFEENKMWFTQKYSYLVPRCGVLNDKCDCRSALNEEFDGTVDIPKIPLNSFHDVNFDDSTPKQRYHFNDVHSVSEMSQVSYELAALNNRNDQQYENGHQLLSSISEVDTYSVSNCRNVMHASNHGLYQLCI